MRLLLGARRGRRNPFLVTPVAAVADKSLTTFEGLAALYAQQKGLARGGGAPSVAASLDLDMSQL